MNVYVCLLAYYGNPHHYLPQPKWLEQEVATTTTPTTTTTKTTTTTTTKHLSPPSLRTSLTTRPIIKTKSTTTREHKFALRNVKKAEVNTADSSSNNNKQKNENKSSGQHSRTNVRFDQK
ncbi:unnamed protein product [Ceratitis capitata]|uniref:(Mediterranean fruit fly) hypothetical protein n=1 Tax=Ceratitis capitata TaxID=7213 RepID=A0A811V1F8_CERCA|nr:unnamed protein product [Ceratitis capitata]